MKYRYVTLLGIILFILQTTVLQGFRIYGVIPNFPLIFTVVFVLLYGNPTGMIFGIVSGVLQDSFMSKVLSINLIIYSLIAIIIGLMEEKIFKDNFLTPIILVSVSTVFYNLIVFTFMYLIKSPIHYSWLLPKIAIEIVENAIIGFFIYRWSFKRVFGYDLR